jgi:hypothetical protein
VFVNLILDRSFPMSIDVVSPLRQRMIEDMTARKLSAGTQRLHISSCKRFAAFLQRSPDTATVEDVRRFQLHLAETGTSIPNRNRLMTGLRFLFRVTLRRLDALRRSHTGGRRLPPFPRDSCVNWYTVNLRSAASSAIIRTSEHFHVFSPSPRLSVRMFGSGGKKRANASSNCAAL